MIKEMIIAAKAAGGELLKLDDKTINEALRRAADRIEQATETILKANAADMSQMAADDPRRDRLLLTAQRISSMASDMRAVATLPSPRREIDRRRRPNGLEIRRMAVPFGVVGVIYEARPNVTADVFGLCFKSGNACVLKGGHDARESNQAIANAIHGALEASGIDPAVMTLLPSTHEAATALMTARGLVDVIIPRGSRRLIDAVRAQSAVPVIETGAGVCHTYLHKDAPREMASAIVNNAKTRRVSVCNALDCAIVHSDLLPSLPEILSELATHHVTIHADERAYRAMEGHYPAELLLPADPSDYGREYLSYAMAVRTVDNLDEALAHIAAHGSGHSEAIVTTDTNAADTFCRDVDAACVYVNAPTSFTDGSQFGLGAEIGISTQKLHARGPMGLDELMTYKWEIRGEGQIRE